MGSDNGSKKSRLSKLTQLENEVAKLSEQLKEDKQTIHRLKESLIERDLRIQELESKLIYAQQSLLKKAVFTIHQCRNQVKSGIDEKIINPAFAHIQQQIEVIQGIVHEAKELIGKKKMLIHNNINATSNRLHHCPDQAIIYFERWIVEPVRLLNYETVGLIDNSRAMIEQKIVHPGKLWWAEMVVVALELPIRSQVMLQIWLAGPVKKIETLPVIANELRANIDALLKRLINQLKSGAEQGVANTVEAVKKSPFWDGNRPVEAVQ